jgi:hypothetical protein
LNALERVEAAPVIEQAYAANQVDLMFQGDWEDAQVYLGLLDHRHSPPPDLRGLMAAQMGFDPAELLGGAGTKTQDDAEDRARAQQNAERKAAAKAKARAKAKRKRARKQRKRK